MSISVAIIADTTTSNVNGSLAACGFSTTAHRTHSTGAIDIMYHLTASDVDCGRTLYNTSQRVILVFYSIAIRIILVRTATATIDVATINISSTAINISIGNADNTLLNIHDSILEGMTILATTMTCVL